jgi:hypothetical protein
MPDTDCITFLYLFLLFFSLHAHNQIINLATNLSQIYLLSHVKHLVTRLTSRHTMIFRIGRWRLAALRLRHCGGWAARLAARPNAVLKAAYLGFHIGARLSHKANERMRHKYRAGPLAPIGLPAVNQQ